MKMKAAIKKKQQNKKASSLYQFVQP